MIAMKFPDIFIKLNAVCKAFSKSLITLSFIY